MRNPSFKVPHIMGLTGDLKYRLFPLSDHTLSMGRDIECDICLDVPNVSRRHAELRPVDGAAWQLCDLGSANGSFVNGESVTCRRLRGQDRILVEEFEFLYIEAGPPPLEADEILRYCDQSLEGVLLRVGGPRQSVKLLNEQTTTIGSGDFNDIVVTDEAVSTNHCKIKNDDGLYTVVDLKSTNGTWVGEKRIETEELLTFGDELTVGHASFRFELRRKERRSPPPPDSNISIILMLAAGILAIIAGSFLFALALLRLFSDAPPFGPVRPLKVRSGWFSTDRSTRGPVLADLDGDGACEVLAAGPGRKVICLDGETGKALWSFRALSNVVAVRGTSDRPRRAGLLLAVTAWGLQAIDVEGRVAWETDYGSFAGEIGAAPAVAERPGPPYTVIGIGTTAGGVFVISGSTGKVLWGFRLNNSSILCSPVFYRQDGMALVVSDHRGVVSAFNDRGSLLWSLDAGACPTISPTAGDIDGDGREEIAVVSGKRDEITVIDGLDGRIILKKTWPGKVLLRPVMGCFKGRGNNRQLVVCSSGYLSFLSCDEERIIAGNLSPTTSPPAVYDFDRDGIDDLAFFGKSGKIIIVSGENGKILTLAKADGDLARGISLGDINADCRLDFVVRLSDGRLESFSTNRPGRKGALPWPSPSGPCDGSGAAGLME